MGLLICMFSTASPPVFILHATVLEDAKLEVKYLVVSGNVGDVVVLSCVFCLQLNVLCFWDQMMCLRTVGRFAAILFVFVLVCQCEFDGDSYLVGTGGYAQLQREPVNADFRPRS